MRIFYLVTSEKKIFLVSGIFSHSGLFRLPVALNRGHVQSADTIMDFSRIIVINRRYKRQSI